jgi:hypothetical protein
MPSTQERTDSGAKEGAVAGVDRADAPDAAGVGVGGELMVIVLLLAIVTIAGSCSVRVISGAVLKKVMVKRAILSLSSRDAGSCRPWATHSSLPHRPRPDP